MMSRTSNVKKGDTAFLRVLNDCTYLFDNTVPFLEKHYAFKRWLHIWERANLPMLQERSFPVSRYAGIITLVFYSFADNEDDFDMHEFAILHTWRMLGKVLVTLITDRYTQRIKLFKEQHSCYVSVVVSPKLKPGSIESMSEDCLSSLHEHFETPYCLVLQDDGFPIQDNLDQFLGKWDYIGAPSVRDSFRQHIADLLLRDCLNGGFSLRSRRYCMAVASNWRIWGSRYSKFRGFGPEEDFLYSCVMRINPWMRIRYRFPGARVARNFAFFDLLGGFDASTLKEKPFGLHGQSTIWQFRETMRGFGYDLDSPFTEFSRKEG